MNFKYLAFSLLLVLTLSCSKEVDPDGCSDQLEDLILGSFDVETVDGKGVVTFNADGTWTDPNNALLSVKINGEWITNKTYTIKSQTVIKVKVADDTGFKDAEYMVVNKTCSEITISYEGIEATMFRV